MKTPTKTKTPINLNKNTFNLLQMPNYENYLSDASLSSDTEEDEEEEESIYDERDEEYWRLEALLTDHRPPVVISYIKTIGYVSLYGCVTNVTPLDIESVVPLGSAISWRAFWHDEPETVSSDVRSVSSDVRSELFSYEDWNAIGEYCMQLCECCFEHPTMTQIRSCIIRILSHGKFVPPTAGRASLRGVRRR